MEARLYGSRPFWAALAEVVTSPAVTGHPGKVTGDTPRVMSSAETVTPVSFKFLAQAERERVHEGLGGHANALPPAARSVELGSVENEAGHRQA